MACDLDAGQWGVAVQSKFLAVGSVVPSAEPEVGAVATQAYANPRYGADGLALLRQGLSAEEVVKRLTEADEGRDQRQLGVVDAAGRGATFTGSGCNDWAGGRTGAGYAAQGNILVSGETVDALAETFEATDGSLAERLLASLAAAQAAGGDSRGQQSAALLVVERDGGYASLSDTLVDLRVDDHETPIEELRRLYDLHDQLFGKTPRGEWLPVDDELRAEIGERLKKLGFERLQDWAGAANLEERVDGEDEIDPVVLNELRRSDVSGYEIASLTEIESVKAVGTLKWTPVRKHFGITAFGISAYTASRGRAGRRRRAHGGATRPRGALRGRRPAGRRSSSTARRRTCRPARSSSCATRR